ncbi:hypothetical protein M0D21_16670 [Aquimarina sp. D1M17]|uniref:hypothetical protein n=1 Tax=Aquimarina acroporae TaxID=2937283 RepID=UPI0020C123E1|nr:hypothetical protein [Aquimarina acroporae]MCK8523215.1 hypothetical protein [Aquimarina acroporae]
MKKLLLVYTLRFFAFCILMCSCGSGGNNTPETTIIGVWKLKQEYSNEGGDTPLKEFPLSNCDKATTLEILKSGRFVEKSYFESSNLLGDCSKDDQETKGDWKRNPEGMFLFIYDKNNILSLVGSVVTIENGNLVVSTVYNDRDLGPRTKLKFIYSKV